jgi:hypothetical protein
MHTYEAEQQEQDTNSFCVFNEENILIAYSKYRDEMHDVSGDRVVVTLNKEQLIEELDKAYFYYLVN